MRRLLKILAFLVALVAFLTWAPLFHWDDAAVVIQRDAGGIWQRQGPSERFLTMNVSRSTSTYSGSRSYLGAPGKSAEGPFHVSRIWIVNLSNDLLSRRIGHVLQKRLIRDSTLDEVAYFPAADLSLEVNRPPHLFVAIRVVRKHETHWPWSHELVTEVQLTASTRPLGANWSSVPERTGPFLSASLEYESDTSGFVSRGVRFDKAARSIAEHFALSEEFQGWREQFGEGVGAPLEWASAPEAAPSDLPLTDDPKARLVASVSPPPLLREHTWIVPAQGDPLARVEAARDTLIGTGWSLLETQNTFDGRPFYFAAENGERLVEVYEPMHHASVKLETEQRLVVVAHQLRPSPQELRAWLVSPGSTVPQREAAIDLLQTLRPPTRAALREALEAEPLPGDQTWALEALR